MDRTKVTNAFEFVAIAGLRARQLMNGCTARVEGDHKPVKIAEREVAAGVVTKIDEKEIAR